MPDIIPGATVVNLLRDVRQEWMSKPEQLQARNDIVGTSDHRRRTMASRWRAMLKAKYGGALWCQVLISTGTIPPRMLELANLQLAQLTLQQKQPRAPASSRGPASAASAGAPTGSQHVVSGQKRQRQHAKKLGKAVHEEEERRSSYGSYAYWTSDAQFLKLKSDAENAMTRALGASRASGHHFTLDGQNYGAPDSSNFAILLAEFCMELNLDVRTGKPTTRNR